MLTPSHFPKFFERLERSVKAEFFDNQSAPGVIYAFTFGQDENVGTLKIYQPLPKGEKGQKVEVVKDWYFHHTLWFKQNSKHLGLPWPYSAFVEFIDEYRENVIISRDPALVESHVVNLAPVVTNENLNFNRAKLVLPIGKNSMSNILINRIANV